MDRVRRVWTRIANQRPTLFARCLFLILCCVTTNLVLWVATLITAPPSGSTSGNGKFASLALIAWTTGLRHGLDADHIAAIDNATRRMTAIPLSDDAKLTVKEKLLWWRRNKGSSSATTKRTEKDSAADVDADTNAPPTYNTSTECRRPTTVGLFFSLGHSTIVVAVTLAVAISISVAGKLSGVGDVGGIIGQSVSGSFLFLVAVINSIILARSLRARSRAKQQQQRQQQQPLSQDDVEQAVPNHQQQHNQDHHNFKGLLTRITYPLLKAVTRPWHMYFVGVAFGIGFDTASTIALLSVAAAAGRGSTTDVDESDAAQLQGGNAKVILLAFLFTAGMTLVDSLDSVLMVYAYAAPDKSRDGKWWALFEMREPLQQQQQERDQEEDKSDIKTEDNSASPTSRGQDAHTLRNLSTSAQNLSLLLTLLSIIMAFVISIIVIMSLLAGNCKPCARSLELHNEPITDTDGTILNNGGLAGRWWNFWDQAGEQSGYIGAGIAGLFLVLVLAWWAGKTLSKRCTHKKAPNNV